MSSLFSDKVFVTVKAPEQNQPIGRGGRRLVKKVTVSNMLRIPRIWISFLTFIVATACNGFLSINLEPKVGKNR